MHLYITLMYALTFIIGLITGSVGLSIQADIADANPKCATSLQKANTGVIILSASMLTATVVLVYCSFTCSKDLGSTQAEEKDMRGQLRMYYGFMLILSIILTTLGALMRDHANDVGNPCPKVKSKANTLMMLGIFGIVIMLGPFALQFAKKGLGVAHESYKAHSRKYAKMSPRSSMCGRKRSSA